MSTKRIKTDIGWNCFALRAIRQDIPFLWGYCLKGKKVACVNPEWRWCWSLWEKHSYTESQFTFKADSKAEFTLCHIFASHTSCLFAEIVQTVSPSGDRVIDVGSEWRTFSNEKALKDPSRVGDAQNPLLNGGDLTTMISKVSDGCVGHSRWAPICPKLQVVFAACQKISKHVLYLCADVIYRYFNAGTIVCHWMVW